LADSTGSLEGGTSRSRSACDRFAVVACDTLFLRGATHGCVLQPSLQAQQLSASTGNIRAKAGANPMARAGRPERSQTGVHLSSGGAPCRSPGALRQREAIGG